MSRLLWPIYQIQDGQSCRLPGFHYSVEPLLGTLKPQPMFISDHPTEYASPWLSSNRPECYTGWFELRQPKVVEGPSPFLHLGQITEWSEQGYDSVVWRDPRGSDAQFPAEIFLFNAQVAQITQMTELRPIVRLMLESQPQPLFTPPDDPDCEYEYLTQII